MSDMPQVLEKLRGRRDIEVAVYFVIRSLCAFDPGRRERVAADAPAIFAVLKANPQRVREVILSLVSAGLIRAGDGYLRVVY